MNQLTYTGIGGTIDYTGGRHESYSADAFNVFIYEDGKVVSFAKYAFCLMFPPATGDLCAGGIFYAFFRGSKRLEPVYL